MMNSQKLKGITGRVLYYYFISICLMSCFFLGGIWNTPIIDDTRVKYSIIVLTVIVLGFLLYKMTCFAVNQEAVDLVDEYERKTKKKSRI